MLVIVVAALLLDYCLGEPKRYHPLAAFGRLATFLEGKMQPLSTNGRRLKWLGLVAWVLLVLTPVILLWFLLAYLPVTLRGFVEVVVLYFTLGLRSLREHGLAVVEPLQAGDLAAAQQKVALIVSRDTDNLSEQGVVNATIESVLENGSDGVLAPIFWFLVLGAPGALLYRFANTLDAMWGYRNQRYQYFGRAAAKLDDALNWIPARLTAVSYALMGNFRNGIHCMNRQGPQTDSPNAGRVMAAGAGALGITVGGATTHRGQQCWRPVMGAGAMPTREHISGALGLLNRVVFLWLFAVAML